MTRYRIERDKSAELNQSSTVVIDHAAASDVRPAVPPGKRNHAAETPRRDDGAERVNLHVFAGFKRRIEHPTQVNLPSSRSVDGYARNACLRMVSGRGFSRQCRLGKTRGRRERHGGQCAA